MESGIIMDREREAGRGGAPDPRLGAVLARDSGADGSFVYAVVTTGVYCRPSCPSRRARSENMRFFDDNDAAEAAGFRPCLRCHPGAPSAAEARAELVVAACHILETEEEAPPLAALAARIGLSPAYFHRAFRQATGLTPKAYHALRRAERLRAALPESGTVTEALYAAGYGSGGRLYAESDALLGMTPARYRDGGRDMAIAHAVAACDLGLVLVARTARGICAVALGEAEAALVADLRARFPKARLEEGGADFAGLVARVIGLIERPGSGIDLPLDLRGTVFQRRVWQALREIPAGETASYAEIGRAHV